MISTSDDRLISYPRADTVATRMRILRTAERLFATNGIDAVSLQQIGREAGQKNRSAAQYHFEDKQGLLIAILDRHTPAISEHRNRLLDDIEERCEERNMRRLAEAFVLPVARKAQDLDGGMDFVRINAQLIGHPRYTLFRLDEVRGRVGSRRLPRMAAAGAPKLPPELALPRSITTTGLVFHGIADWSRVVEGRVGRATESHWSALIDHLVYGVTALLSLPSPSSSRKKKESPHVTD